MEPIKQEIINNIFENGDKLITGPILQTVLIDMIDDVNGKDQEILSKTGSWDDAVTQIPNLATKEEVTNLSESVARDIANVDVDLTGYATETWVQSQGYLTEHQDISNLATKTELTEAKNNLQGNITSLSESVARDIANVDVDLTGYATEQWVQSQDYASKTYVNDAVSSSSVDLTGYATETWVQSQGYLTEHQDISGLATKTELNDTKNNLQGNITSLSESVARDIANVDLTGYATEQWVQNQGYLTEHQDISNLATKTELNDTKDVIQSDMVTLSGSMAKSIEDSAIAIGTEIQNKDYASKTYVNDAVASSSVDLTGYATEQWVQNQGYLKEHQDISGLATKTELTSVSESVQTDITNLSESVANSAVWKKGTGTDSIVQVVTDGSTYIPSATGKRAIATGYRATASGDYSYAEGNSTASGSYSHAEGHGTVASGIASHAEGYYTTASNTSEHAQGRFNHSSENQIFSVGAGEWGDISNLLGNRRNAISVLAVPNAETQINTASFFVQNIGGYDGTNPLPGTNDLATVINGLSSGGGSSETLWKKGTGTDSIVQILSGDNETKTSTASGVGAIALGFISTASGDFSHAGGEGTLASGRYGYTTGQFTTASGDYSHAEGASTKALEYCSHAEGEGTIASGHTSHAEGNSCQSIGQASHAEGQGTKASGFGSHAEGDTSNASGMLSHAEGQSTLSSGQASHAEGFFTIASNNYEHAQGRYNHNSENQIFSIGTGESDASRRNAISVLAVPNSGRYTSSVFIQNVGGYDGTNPTPGTNDLATVINNLPSGGGSSETLWKKGTGKNSIVQVIEGIPLFQPRATGDKAIATGFITKASGESSHAEGNSTEASGLNSHAEGAGTIAANEYEHAQGRYNHNSENQIFSVGTGNSKTDRRNAVSVLEVSNNNSYTGSFFVQNIGGYDGTNPLPGTNDLATVINGMSTGGGTATSTETWTFTLDDGSTVTKTIVIA